jgi:hypothetical protein
MKLLGAVLVKILLFGMIIPLVQATAAWLLLKRTDWCLRKAGVGAEPPQM